MIFKNIIDTIITDSILDFCYLTPTNFIKKTFLLWKNDSDKIGLTLKLYNQTKDLKNYILKISWIFNDDKFIIADQCKDFSQSIGIDLSKKIIELLN